MLLMPQPASVAELRMTATAAMRRKPCRSMGIAPGCRSHSRTYLARSGMWGSICGRKRGQYPIFWGVVVLPPEEQVAQAASRVQRHGKFLERAHGEGTHVGGAIGVTGPEREDPLRGAGDRDAGVSGRITVAIASRSGGAGLGQTPRCAVPVAHGGGNQNSVR